MLYIVWCSVLYSLFFFFFQAEDGIRDLVRSRGLGDVYKRQEQIRDARDPGVHRVSAHRSLRAHALDRRRQRGLLLSLIHI